MRVLFDQGTPVPLRKALVKHTVETAHERSWSSLKNGELLAAAEAAGFEVLVTTDKSLKYQQNLSARKVAVVVLLTTSWPRIQLSLPAVAAAVDSAASGSYIEVAFE
jgi:predicted nuclease of predicted toxin-antitoxin system